MKRQCRFTWLSPDKLLVKIDGKMSLHLDILALTGIRNLFIKIITPEVFIRFSSNSYQMKEEVLNCLKKRTHFENLALHVVVARDNSYVNLQKVQVCKNYHFFPQNDRNVIYMSLLTQMGGAGV